VQAIDVAKERGLDEVVFTTGGKSEAYAMKLYPNLPEEAFVQMGDFVGTAIRHAARRQMRQATLVAMIGKLSKIANGKMQTHAAGSEVNLDLLADFAAELGASPEVVARIRSANTARHVLEICSQENLLGISELICRRAVEHTTRHAGAPLTVKAWLVDFDGTVLGQYPPPRTDPPETEDAP
jgi:cobalt-precorrin-5B (C1)-methyltransferase